MSKITVYGMYNYGNINDQKEHLSATPKMENVGYETNGNVYEFETKHEVKIIKRNYYDEELEFLVVKAFGRWYESHIESKKGIAYLVNTEAREVGYSLKESSYEILGNIKAHKIKEY